MEQNTLDSLSTRAKPRNPNQITTSASGNEDYAYQLREIGDRWVDADAAARMYEETKSSILAQKKAELGDIPDNKAERMVKSSRFWMDFITEGVNLRTEANRLKIQIEEIKMRHMINQSREATERAERKM